MLQFPINVSPDNTAITPTAFPYSYTFKGDILSGWVIRFTDYETGASTAFTHGIKTDRTPWGYNNTDISFTVQASFDAGKSYVWQIMFVQYTIDGTTAICDMPTNRGSVISADGASITIDSGIETIYQWNENAGVCLPTYIDNVQATEMQIKIGSEKRSVVSYDKNTGVLVVDSAFDEEVTQGARYQIYANYLITPQYFFKSLNLPELTTSSEIAEENYDICLKNVGTYSQDELSLIKYWNMSVGWSYTSSSTSLRQVAETGDVYSQDISYKFYDAFASLAANGDILIPDDNRSIFYKFTTNVVTQDNAVVTNTNTLAVAMNTTVVENPPTMRLQKFKLDKNTTNPSTTGGSSVGVTLNLGDLFGSGYRKYRLNLDTKEIVQLYGRQSDYDITVPNQGNFRYAVIIFDDEGRPYNHHIITEDISVDYNYYTITELIPYNPTSSVTSRISQSDRDKQFYDVGRTYHFDCDISDTSTNVNTGTVTHVGGGQYATVSTNDNLYESGEFSALLGVYDEETQDLLSDAKMVKEWEEFISQDKLFLFKSSKGNVRIIAITDKITIECAETTIQKPITVGFSWVEVGDINDMIIGNYI